jgi:hypothetical protein
MSCHFQHHPNRNPVYTNTTQIIDPIFPPSSNHLTNHQNPSTQNFPITSDQIIKIHLRTANPISSIWFRMEIPYPYWKVCLGGMLRRYASGLLQGYASGSASRELHHMELTSYLRGFQRFQQTLQPFIYLCVYPCTYIYILYIYIQRER